MVDLSQLIRSIRNELADDYIGLWTIVREVQQTATDPNEVTELTISLVRELLKDPLVVAGDFVGGKFVRSSESSNELVTRIEAQWKALGRSPDIGEIVWFSLSNSGASARRAD